MRYHLTARVCAHLLAGGILLGHDPAELPLSVGPMHRAVTPEGAPPAWALLVGNTGEVSYEGELFEAARLFADLVLPESVSFR